MSERNESCSSAITNIHCIFATRTNNGINVNNNVLLVQYLVFYYYIKTCVTDLIVFLNITYKFITI